MAEDPSRPDDGAVPTRGLGSAVARGAAWTVAFRMMDRTIGLISTLILARLLAPEDFGLIAMATTLLAFIEVLTVGEFSSAIIQNPNAERRHYDTAWTLNASFGLGAALLLAALAYPTAQFFNEPRLAAVVLAFCALPLLDGLFNIGCVDFRKHLQFDKDFLLQVGRKLSGFVVVLPLAYFTRSYWALVLGMIAGRAGGLLLSYALHPFRPRPSLEATRSLFGFSGWLMLNNALTFLNVRGAHLVIGRMLGPQPLGLYTVSHEMAHLPTTELASPLNRAIFPGYSKLQHDLDALGDAFLRVLGVIAVATIPAGVGMAAIAHLFVPVVLGPQWIAGIPLITLLALAGTLHAVQVNIESVYYAMGRPRLKAFITLMEVLLFLPLLVAVVPRHGLVGVAGALLVTVCIAAPVNFGLVLRMLRMPASRVIGVLWRPTLAALSMWLLLHFAFTKAPAGSTAAAAGQLAAAVAAGAGTYGLMLLALWAASGRPAGAERWLLDQLVALVRARRSR
jgi:O-antigen/teichoic acid export membrane protein